MAVNKDKIIEYGNRFLRALGIATLTFMIACLVLQIESFSTISFLITTFATIPIALIYK